MYASSADTTAEIVGEPPGQLRGDAKVRHLAPL